MLESRARPSKIATSAVYSPRRPRSWVYKPVRSVLIPQPGPREWLKYFCEVATDWELLRFIWEALRGGWGIPRSGDTSAASGALGIYVHMRTKSG